MKLLVCGRRDYADYDTLKAAIVALKPTGIAHGAASGADSLAGQVADELGLPVTEYPANWRRYGRAAGMIRNKEMLRDYAPDAVLAAPGGRGTANMVAIARKAGVPTHMIEAEKAADKQVGSEAAPDAAPRVLSKRLGERDGVYIGRPGKWGNPFIEGRDGTRDEVVEKYREYLEGNSKLMGSLEELRGKNLVCWCAPARCHGDVLLALANRERPREVERQAQKAVPEQDYEVE